MTSPTPAAAPWPSMRGGPANLGRMLAPPEPRDGPVCTFQTGGPVFSTPVIGAGEQIYVGSADRCFYRLDPGSGREVWRVETDEIIDSAACIGDDGRVFVPGADGRVYAFDADGKEVWRYDRMLDRSRPTPSTIYWWEANVVFGPTGWLYAGSDDFYLYALEPYVGVRWATPTGLQIWAAPAFEGSRLFVSSFDRHVYALDAESGRVLWRRNLGNFIASSPAVAQGLVVVGSFDHHVSALDAATGRVVWRAPTGGPIYASAAVDGDQVMIGSMDGSVYAFDLRTGAARWSRWLGAPIRGSAAVGEHLYVPGGDGWLIALDHDGALHGRYDTRQPGALNNLNASVALGRHGLCVASASGAVVYLPYRAIPTTPEPEAEREGIRLVVETPGGTAGEPIGPGDAVGVRVLHTRAGITRPGRIRSANVPVAPDGNQLHVVAEPGEALRVKGTFSLGEGTTEHAFDEPLEIPWVASHEGLLDEGFRATRLSVESPSIVATFDQIGLASLSIEVGVLHREGERVVAWGIQRFGMDESGAAVGVPDPRIHYYAFDGTWRDGTLELESGPCLFEITAFPVPLTRLRIVAHQREGGLTGGSLLLEADARAALRALPSLLPSGSWARIRSWLPERPRLADLRVLARMLLRMLALLPAFLRGMWKPWGLLDDDLRFHGVGSFQVAPAPDRRSALELVDARVHRGRVVARWRGGGPRDAPGILLLRDGRPVPWPYSLRTRVQREAGAPVRSELDVRAGVWDEAWVLRDHERVARLPNPGRRR